jgi:hypothetical protein
LLFEDGARLLGRSSSIMGRLPGRPVIGDIPGPG